MGGEEVGVAFKVWRKVSRVRFALNNKTFAKCLYGCLFIGGPMHIVS